MSLVKFAVVGCGNVGSRHLAVIQAQEGAQVVGFCDIDPGKLQKYAALYDGVKGYDSIDILLQHSDADVVSVCTPHYLHAEHTLQAIQAGRHVLVESQWRFVPANATG
jgi:predicted dehydrogenase